MGTDLSYKIKEKRLLVSMIGVFELLKEKIITIDEAEAYLFSPRNIKMFKDEGVSEEILHILEECCELEDIESLLPERLSMEICEFKNRTIEILKEYPCIDEKNRLQLRQGAAHKGNRGRDVLLSVRRQGRRFRPGRGRGNHHRQLSV